MDKDSIHIDDYFSELISKYLSGNVSSSEVEELETWVLADPSHKHHFVALKKAWMLAGLQQSTPKVDVHALWEQTSNQLWEEAKVVEMKPQSNRFKWLTIAAAIILLLFASIVIFQNLNQKTAFIVEATEEVKTVDLSDGSTVTLNQTSSIQFTDAGKSPKRQVKLKGDAFFDVAKDEAHPFVIHIQNMEIEVLGTSFYVDARENQSEIQVVVESGKVAVRSGDSETILSANEKAIFQKSTQILTKVQNEDANYLALKTKTLVFENTKLEDVVFALNRQFHADISLENDALKDCLLTATYRQDSLSSILTIMEATMGIEVSTTGQQTVLGGGCENGNPGD